MPIPEERFWPKVNKTESCWLWTASNKQNGYGQFHVAGRMVLAHRFAYELLVGPIPEGLELDHVRARGCLNRNCVNPEHLEPVSHAENTRRGDSSKHQAAKTHCPQGHAYNEENTYVNAGKRSCRTCGRASLKASRKANRQKLLARSAA